MVGSVSKLLPAFHQMQLRAQSHEKSSQRKYELLFVLMVHKDMEGTGFITGSFAPWNTKSLTLPGWLVWCNLVVPRMAPRHQQHRSAYGTPARSQQAGANSGIPHLPTKATWAQPMST